MANLQKNSASEPELSPKRSLKERLKDVNWPITILIIGIVAGVVFCLIPPPADINPKGWYALGILIPVVAIWATSAIPVGVGALLFLALVVGFHLVPSDVAFRGFTTGLPWLLVGAFAMGQAMVKTGLSARFSLWLMARAKGFWGTIGACYIANLLLAGVPSATARCAILAPVLNGIMDTLGRPKDSRLSRLLTFNFCHATQTLLATATLTGGAINVTLLAVYQSVTGNDVGWIDWLIVMLLPTIIYLVVGTLAAYMLEPPEPELVAKLRDTSAARNAYEKLGPMKASEWRVVVLFVTLIVLWVIGSWIGLNSGFAALIIMGVLFLPGIGVLEPKALREINWDIAMLVGASFGVAGVLDQTGMIQVVANALISPVLNPLLGLGTFGVILGGIIVGLIAHFLLPTPANLTLAIPLLISWGVNIAHLPDAEVVAFLMFLSAMTSQIVPLAYQQPPYYVYLGLDVTNVSRFNLLLMKVWPFITAGSIVGGYVIYFIVRATGIGLS